MEAYYPIFVLMLTLCEAPAGKTVCEKGTLHFRFADALDCYETRATFIEYYDKWSNVIVDRAATRCEVRIETVSNTDREAVQKDAEERLRQASSLVPEPARR